MSRGMHPPIWGYQKAVKFTPVSEKERDIMDGVLLYSQMWGDLSADIALNKSAAEAADLYPRLRAMVSTGVRLRTYVVDQKGISKFWMKDAVEHIDRYITDMKEKQAYLEGMMKK